ncbi:MAG: hypothetical protein QXH37_06545 [Candidatus Bathyarchaeia archaeon]
MSGQVYDFPRFFTTKAYEEKDKLFEAPFFFYEYYFNYFVRSSEMLNIHYANFQRVAITYGEFKFGKEKNGRREIFEAVNQLVKFQSYDFKETANQLKEAEHPYFPVMLSFLAIVLDGLLFEATIENGQIQLEERDHILLHTRSRPKYATADFDYWIDIVKKEHFCKYMEEIDNDISLIGSKIIANRDLLKKYLTKDKTP